MCQQNLNYKSIGKNNENGDTNCFPRFHSTIYRGGESWKMAKILGHSTVFSTINRSTFHVPNPRYTWARSRLSHQMKWSQKIPLRLFKHPKTLKFILQQRNVSFLYSQFSSQFSSPRFSSQFLYSMFSNSSSQFSSPRISNQFHNSQFSISSSAVCELADTQYRNSGIITMAPDVRINWENLWSENQMGNCQRSTI